MAYASYAFGRLGQSLSAELVAKVRQVALALGARQEALADFCACSQGHLSKVLAGKASASPRIATRLQEWLDAQPPTTPPTDAEIAQLVTGFNSIAPDRRMHILHILRELAALA